MASSNGNGNGLALKHNPGLSTNWTAEEQSLLDDLLSKYASDSNIERYAKIAAELPNKSMRDVALRCSWMTEKGKQRKEDIQKQEKGKQRKEDIQKQEKGKQRKEDKNSSRKIKGKKVKVTEPSAKSEKVADPSTESSSHVMNRGNDGRISFKGPADIGGLSGYLLEQNAQALKKISENFSSFKIHENLNLLAQTRNNIRAMLDDLNQNDMPEAMKKMPPIPVKLDEELANFVLSGGPMQNKT